MAVEGPLVEVPAVEPADADGDRGGEQRVPAGVAGTKVFRDYDQDQALLLPPSLRWSSRKIARAYLEGLALRFLAANQAAHFRSIARFRQRHLAAIENLYVQVLRLAHRAGLVKLGQVAVDGTKLRADASPTRR